MKIDKRLLRELNKPLAIIPRPFQPLAKKLGWQEEKVISLLKAYRRTGLLRRFGGILSHRNIGLKTNVLVAWNAAPQKIVSSARELCGQKAVSHCYLRQTRKGWPYNLYSMIHAADKKTAERLIHSLARKIKIKDFLVLFTVKELKKTKADLGGH